MTQILHKLAADGRTRAFGEAAEWNTASLSSFGMTAFRQLGFARKFTVFGRTMVWWEQRKAVEQQKKSEKDIPVLGSGCKDSSVRELRD